MKRVSILRYSSVALVLLGIASIHVGVASAVKLEITFEDPRGDGIPVADTPNPQIDVERVLMTFDNTTGDYDIVWTTFDDSPFLGRFRINTLLYNADASEIGDPLLTIDGIPQSPNRFSDNVNDFLLEFPQTNITLSGNSPVLKRWNVGNRVAANGGSFPEECCFANGIIAFDAPGDPREILGTSITGDLFTGFDLDIQTTVQASVPEPASLLVVGFFASAALPQSRLTRRYR